MNYDGLSFTRLCSTCLSSSIMLAQPGSHGKDRAQEKGQILKVSLGQGPELEQLHPHQILEGKLEGVGGGG